MAKKIVVFQFQDGVQIKIIKCFAGNTEEDQLQEIKFRYVSDNSMYQPKCSS